MRIPELLAPAGCFEHVKTAVNAGASAVYLSGKKYGARKFSKNFTLEEIEKATDLCHLHNVKVYVTVNTLIKEREIEDVINYLSRLYSIGVDAVLIQDLGLIELINKYLPGLKIHASTQITAENQMKLDYLESRNVKRVVLPREMRYDEIKNLNTKMELEIFVHGALCYCYSGQCLMSSFKGGRSGNRGSCAQPCRQKYRISKKFDYYLSPTDLCLYNKLKEISQLNITSIKIEGRMRNKEYLAVAVSTYRKALNKLKSNKQEKTENLNLIFNRGYSEGGFSNKTKRSIQPGHVGLEIGSVYKTHKNQIAIKINDSVKTIPEKGDGLLILKNGNSYGLEISQNPTITSLNHFKKGKNKQMKDLSRKNKIMIIKKVKQNKKINFNLEGSSVYLTKRNSISKKVTEIETKKSSYKKSNLILTFSVKNNYPYLKGRITLPNKKEFEIKIKGKSEFEKPIKKSVSKQTIKNQLLKTDNYPYNITQINVNYDGTLFIPISKINELRRDLFRKLEDEITKSYKHKNKRIKPDACKCKKQKEINLSYYTDNLNHLEKITDVKRVYLEIPSKEDSSNINYMVNFLKTACEISRDKNYELIWKWPGICHDKLIKNFNKVRGILNKMHYNIPIMNGNFNCEYGPYSMNITNTESVKSLKNYKIITLSPELSRNDYEDIIKNTDQCKVELLVQGNVELMKTRYDLFDETCSKLTDTKGNIYPVHKSISSEEIIILSDRQLSLLEEIPYLIKTGYRNFSIDGRWKDDNYLKMIDIYRKAISGDINKKELIKISPKNTKANF